MQEDSFTETRISSERIYQGRILDLYRDDVRLPDGGAGVREYIRHVGAACVVPLLDDGTVLMVRQFRYPFGRVLLEIPAGKLDRPGEPPLEAAKRELREETGAEADEMIDMGEYYPTCAYSNEVIRMYLARGLRFGDASPDEDEFIACERIPLTQLVTDVMEGSIRDGKTQTALLKAWLLAARDVISG